MDRTMLRRAAACLSVLGLTMVGTASLAPVALASSNSSVPQGFSPDGRAHANTYTVKTADTDNCHGIIFTPGSDPATKAIDSTVQPPPDFTAGSVVPFVVFDNAHTNGGTNNYTLHDCIATYPPGTFTASDFQDNQINGSGEPAPGSESKFKQYTSVVDQALLTGVGDNTKPVTYNWTIPADAPAGMFICNFVKDTGNNHGGHGNRKAAACFEVTAPDLAITKTVDKPSITATGDLTYTVKVTNTGSAPATTVSVTDATPTGTTFVSVTPASGNATSFTCSGSTAAGVTCSAASLPAGETDTFTIVDHVTGPIANSTVITNTANVTAGNVTNDTDDTATARTTEQVPLVADLSITKQVDKPSITATGDLTYTVAVTNSGNTAATTVSVTDATPTGTTFVSVTPASGNATSFTCSGSTAAGVTCSAASLPAGETDTFTIVDHVTGPIANSTVITNTANVTAANVGNDKDDSASATTTEVVPGCQESCTPDLSITKVVDKAVITATGDLTYTVAVTNTGNAAATTVSMTDATPTGTTFVSVTPAGGNATSFTCSGSTASGVTCSAASLPAGETDTFTIVDHVTGPIANSTVITNTANVTAGNVTNDTDDSASATTTEQVPPVPDLSITKTVDQAVITTPGNLTYTVKVTNSGNAAATTVSMTDATPTGTTFVSVTPASGNATSFTCSGSTAAGVTCTAASLPAGETDTFTIVDHVTGPLTSGTVITNTATVTAGNVGNDTDDSASATTTEQPPSVCTTNCGPPPCTANCTTSNPGTPDVAVVKTGPSSVVAGNNITYTLTATNNGTATDDNVVVTDTIDPNTTFVSAGAASGTTGTCTVSGNLVTCTDAASLAPGATAVFTVTVNVPANTTATSVTDTAVVSATSVTTDTDDTSTVTTTITKPTPAVLPESGSTVPPTTTTTVPKTTPKATPTEVLPLTGSRTLPFTGTNVRLLLLAGLGLVLLGLGLLVGTWRTPNANHYRG